MNEVPLGVGPGQGPRLPGFKGGASLFTLCLYIQMQVIQEKDMHFTSLLSHL